MIDVEILYESGPCLVIAKPGGIATQAPAGIESVESRVKGFLKIRDAKPGRVYLGVPHRLDRPVSGALVVALHARATRRLAEQFQGRTVGKSYWAVVEGRIGEDAGQWTDWMRKIPNRAQAEMVAQEHPDARLARLSYRVLGREPCRTWVEIALETGRMHQIRLQFSSRGHPISGDQQYGAVTAFGPETEDPRRRWIALHARRLHFRHPMTREVVECEAPLPPPWHDLDLWPIIRSAT
jgi:23S rRNA pseudouridine1911/1915/1917 synthase